MSMYLAKRYTAWSATTLGNTPYPGVISRNKLTIDGNEGSHLGTGWHKFEADYRWTEDVATLYLLRERGQDVLELELWPGPVMLGPVRITLEASGVALTRQYETDKWVHMRLAMPPQQAEKAILPVRLSVDHLRDATTLGAGDVRRLGVAVRSCKLIGRSRSNNLPLSSLCNPAHWMHPLWQAVLASLACRTAEVVIAPEIQHRKMWEWVHGVAGLARLGCLRPEAVALGVAAGHEPVIYWLANRISWVCATDLYDGAFANHEANPDVLRFPERYSPYPYPTERVHFMRMNGIHIAFADATFDFVFSFCSIEHFGSRENSLQALREMKRVLKPGGIAAVSTEVSLNDVGPKPEVFSPWELYEELIYPSGLLLVGDIAPAHLETYIRDPVSCDEVISAKPHFVLRDGDAFYTSVMLFLQKCD
jgi:SAM-dependent methyltransferase